MKYSEHITTTLGVHFRKITLKNMLTSPRLVRKMIFREFHDYQIVLATFRKKARCNSLQEIC